MQINSIYGFVKHNPFNHFEYKIILSIKIGANM